MRYMTIPIIYLYYFFLMIVSIPDVPLLNSNFKFIYRLRHIIFMVMARVILSTNVNMQ